MVTHRVNIPKPRSSLSEKPEWKKIFDGQVQKDDEMWKEYLKEADEFDDRIVERWNKIVDVILVYVTLFIAILTPFVTDSSKQFKRDPTHVSNDILIAIYQHLVAQSNNISTPSTPIDTLSIYALDKAGNDRAVISNALLFSALAISTVVSMVALAAKLWLVNYSRRTFDTVGSPYERAINRQEAYNGVLEWKMVAVINTLPLMLLVALVMFGFFIHQSVADTQQAIGYAVGTVLTLGLVSLIITSLAAAFIPACPFHSPFSTIIQLTLEFPLKLYQILSRKLQFKLPVTIQSTIQSTITIQALQILGFLVSGAGIGYLSSAHSSGFFVLVSIPVAMIFAYLTQGEKIKHKPQRYRLPLWSLCFFLFIGSFLSAAGYFSSSADKRHVFVPLYAVGMVSLLLFGWMAGRLSKSMSVTGEIDAIAWLLKTHSDKLDSKDLFKKAGQIASSPHGSDYKSRLLELLFPLLSSLINHHTAEPDDSQLEVYVSCLALLSDFTEDRGRGYALLWEDTKRRPKLQDALLCEKLIEMATNPRYDDSNLKNAASALVYIYANGPNGNQKLKEACSKLHKRHGSGDADSITTLTESPHSYEEMELNYRRKNGYYRVDVV